MSRAYVISITIVAILVIIAGISFARRSAKSIAPSTNQVIEQNKQDDQATTGKSSTATVEGLTVTYTDSGFSPSALTINAGDTVTFINQSSEPMWVASNPHPSHTDYPGFDARGGVAKGQRYLFKFDKVGTWGYHNHLDSAQTGLITVH